LMEELIASQAFPAERAARELGGLDAIFAPRAVAVIGAGEKEQLIARTVLSNLVNHPFGGAVYPISSNESHVLGIKAYPNVRSAPERIDLAVIATPAPAVPDIVGECADAGVKGAIILSPGFRETGESGAELERRVLDHARRGQMRIIGPNCLGVMNTTNGLNATFSHAMARRGNVAFVSQSGALCASVLDWSLRENVGFSAFISIGSMLDVGWGDLIYYLSDDPHTRSIILYMESVGDARSFLSAAREVTLTRPIIVLKAGRTEGAARAAASHTGGLTGSDEVYDAAFRRCGAVRVNSLSDLFYMAEVFAKQPRPLGPRLTILTNAGGPGVLAVDSLLAAGGELAQLSAETTRDLDQLLPPHWSHNNPIDLQDDAGPERYARALEIAARDSSTNGFLIILTPQASTDPTETAEALKPFAQSFGKPILASWMGGARAQAGENILNRVSIPTFPYPDTAARMFDYMWGYTYNLRGIYETPTLPSDGDGAPDRPVVERIVQAARMSKRTILTEHESKQILAAYHIPIVQTRVANEEEEAVSTANEIGYPVVLKIHSDQVVHKSDVGGVRLNLCDAQAVRCAYQAIAESARELDIGSDSSAVEVTVQPMIVGSGFELIVGSSVDAQFGPVLLFGTGGRQVEVLQDHALALPPLNTTLARRMMEQTRVYQALQGNRGHRSADLAALEEVLVRFSQLVVEQRWIKEIDINPLLALPVPSTPSRKGQEKEARPASANGGEEGRTSVGSEERALVALDARIVLYGMEMREEQLPTPAIRPYPSQYVQPWTTGDGIALLIRPIRPEDEPLMIQFHTTLSDRSVYFRYMHAVQLSQRIAHERLARICFNDYDRELALVAERLRPTLTPSSKVKGPSTAPASKTEGPPPAPAYEVEEPPPAPAYEVEEPPPAPPSKGGEDEVAAAPSERGGAEIAVSPAHEREKVSEREILAVGRLSKLHGRNEAEFAIIISDAFQGHGLGTELLRRLLQIGRDEGLDRIVGFIASDNTAMQRVCGKLGFRLHRSFADPEVQAIIDL
jgi:acetyltransferase